VNKVVIAERLRTYRGNRTRREIAARIGVSTSALRMYEYAERIPRDEVKLSLARCYGVSVQALFFDDAATDPPQTQMPIASSHPPALLPVQDG